MKKLLLILFFTASFASLTLAYGESPSDSLPKLQTALKPLIMQTFQELQVPGVIIGVWMKGYQPYVTTLGYSNLKTRTPMSPSDKVRIGSITKTFVGIVVLQLAEEGKLSLSDPLSKYFPDYPNGQNINLEELGNMTSGIFNYLEDPQMDDFVSTMKKGWTPQELIDIAKKHPPYFPPGTSMHYSNTNTILLGLIIEKITGNSLQNEIQKRIFTPLRMTNTTFPRDTAFPNPHAHGYYYADSTTHIEDVTNLNASAGWAAGAIVSTLGDLYKFAKPLATGQLLSKALHQEQLKMNNDTLAYGFAIANFNGGYGHNGGIPGYNSFMIYIPSKDATVIVFVNMQNNKKGIPPADYIGRELVTKLKGMKN